AVQQHLHGFLLEFVGVDAARGLGWVFVGFHGSLRVAWLGLIQAVRVSTKVPTPQCPRRWRGPSRQVVISRRVGPGRRRLEDRPGRINDRIYIAYPKDKDK